MKGLKKTLLRTKSQDSTSSKNKEAKPSATAVANASPPPPPPNSAKPLPQPSSAVASLNHLNNNGSNHSLPSTNGSANRTSATSATPLNTDRRYPAPDRASAAPPIVVVSPDASADQSERHSLTMDSAGGPLTPPRANLNRLRPTGPKDTIPMVG